MRRLLTSVVAAVLIAPVAIVLASKRQVIESHWRDRDVAIDGDNGEWPGPLVPVEENHPLLTAVMNDGQFLYLLLSTNDSSLRRQIFRQGLIVWFDPSGGDKKHFGVKYPVGVPPEESGRGSYRRGYGGGRPDPGSTDAGQSRPADPEPIDRLEIYGPEKDDAHSFVTTMAPGIAVKTGNVEGYAVYELKVPLEKTAQTPYAIEAKPGALVGLGLETPKMEQPLREGRGGGFGGIGGGMGGRGGGMGGHGGGRGGGERGASEQLKPLKMWASIRLTAKSE